MGGYGALKLALRECDRFCAGAGLSPCADLKTVPLGDAIPRVFGSIEEISAQDDLLSLADMKANDPNKPRRFIGVGFKDFLYENNFEFRRKLAENGFDFTYRESEGEHSWAFCDEYIQYVLKWMFKE